MASPVSLTDDQIGIVLGAARRVPRKCRQQYLQCVADELAAMGSVSTATVTLAASRAGDRWGLGADALCTSITAAQDIVGDVFTRSS
jgi:hypothetical protein